MDGGSCCFTRIIPRKYVLNSAMIWLLRLTTSHGKSGHSPLISNIHSGLMTPMLCPTTPWRFSTRHRQRPLRGGLSCRCVFETCWSHCDTEVWVACKHLGHRPDAVIHGLKSPERVRSTSRGFTTDATTLLWQSVPWILGGKVCRRSYTWQSMPVKAWLRDLTLNHAMTSFWHPLGDRSYLK